MLALTIISLYGVSQRFDLGVPALTARTLSLSPSLGLSRIRGIWFGTIMPSILAILCQSSPSCSYSPRLDDAPPAVLCLATADLVLTLLGLKRARLLGAFSPPGSPLRYAEKSLWFIFFEEKHYWTAIIWASQFAASVRRLLS